jgi:hypothetical protein
MYMKHELIDDFGLEAWRLQDKYGDSHPVIKLATWKRAVRDDSTMLGYWAFVAKRVEAYQEELDESNPHTQWERDMEL